MSAEEGRHRLQDLQSLAKADPAHLQQAKDTVMQWLERNESRSATLWREWLDIIDTGTWRKVHA